MIIQNKSELYSIFHYKLIEEKLIKNSDKIRVTEINPIIQNGEIIHHHIIAVESTNIKYLIRTIKDKDYSYLVMDHLMLLNNRFNNTPFPYALTQPFVIGNHSYIVTTYLEGETLESQIKTFSNKELVELSYKIDDNLSLVHSVTSKKYFDGKQTVDISFGEIMYNNIYHQFHNTNNIFARKIDVNKLLKSVNLILSKSSYSQPTIVHMDLKPANIIISPKKNVHLIDFELARFADLDYEWTNILVKLEHTQDERFKHYVLNPIIERNFLTLDEALLVDKYKVYLLYLTINKYLAFIEPMRK